MKKSPQSKVIALCICLTRLGLPLGLQLCVLEHVKWQDVASRVADRYVGLGVCRALLLLCLFPPPPRRPPLSHCLITHSMHASVLTPCPRRTRVASTSHVASAGQDVIVGPSLQRQLRGLRMQFTAKQRLVDSTRLELDTARCLALDTQRHLQVATADVARALKVAAHHERLVLIYKEEAAAQAPSEQATRSAKRLSQATQLQEVTACKLKAVFEELRSARQQQAQVEIQLRRLSRQTHFNQQLSQSRIADLHVAVSRLEAKLVTDSDGRLQVEVDLRDTQQLLAETQQDLVLYRQLYTDQKAELAANSAELRRLQDAHRKLLSYHRQPGPSTPRSSPVAAAAKLKRLRANNLVLAKELDVLRCELQQEALRAGRIHIHFKTESGRLTLIAQRIIRAVLRVCPADSKVMPLVEAVLSELPGLTFENIPSNNSVRAQKQVNLGMSLSFVQKMAQDHGTGQHTTVAIDGTYKKGEAGDHVAIGIVKMAGGKVVQEVFAGFAKPSGKTAGEEAAAVSAHLDLLHEMAPRGRKGLHILRLGGEAGPMFKSDSASTALKVGFLLAKGQISKVSGCASHKCHNCAVTGLTGIKAWLALQITVGVLASLVTTVGREMHKLFFVVMYHLNLRRDLEDFLRVHFPAALLMIKQVPPICGSRFIMEMKMCFYMYALWKPLQAFMEEDVLPAAGTSDVNKLIFNVASHLHDEFGVNVVMLRATALFYCDTISPMFHAMQQAVNDRKVGEIARRLHAQLPLAYDDVLCALEASKPILTTFCDGLDHTSKAAHAAHIAAEKIARLPNGEAPNDKTAECLVHVSHHFAAAVVNHFGDHLAGGRLHPANLSAKELEVLENTPASTDLVEGFFAHEDRHINKTSTKSSLASNMAPVFSKKNKEAQIWAGLSEERKVEEEKNATAKRKLVMQHYKEQMKLAADAKRAKHQRDIADGKAQLARKAERVAQANSVILLVSAAEVDAALTADGGKDVRNLVVTQLNVYKTLQHTKFGGLNLADLKCDGVHLWQQTVDKVKLPIARLRDNLVTLIEATAAAAATSAAAAATSAAAAATSATAPPPTSSAVPMAAQRSVDDEAVASDALQQLKKNYAQHAKATATVLGAAKRAKTS